MVIRMRPQTREVLQPKTGFGDHQCWEFGSRQLHFARFVRMIHTQKQDIQSILRPQQRVYHTCHTGRFDFFAFLPCLVDWRFLLGPLFWVGA